MVNSEELIKRITELEAQNAELIDKLSFLSAAVDNMPNPVFMKGQDGRFVFFNKSYAECFSMSKEKYLGCTVLDMDYLPQEDRCKYHEEDMELIKSGKICSYSKDFIFDDGKVHPSIYWSKGFVCPETGVHGLVGEIVDISVERRDKDNLKRIVQDAAYMFDRFFIINLVKKTFINVKKTDERGNSLENPISIFFDNTCGRFYNPVNNELLDRYFSIEGIFDVLMDADSYYFECKDKLSDEIILGTTLYCIERADGIPSKVIYAVHDITAAKKLESEYRQNLRAANEKLKDLANHDGLTGLYNRRGLLEAINLKLNKESKIALLVIDIDKFKAVNDSFGHKAGDELLVKLSGLFKSSFRSDDIIARLGGDEFMVIVNNCVREHSDFIQKKIKYINYVLNEAKDNIPAASISAGIAFSKKGETHGLYDRADIALYKAKEDGRSNVCVYEDFMSV